MHQQLGDVTELTHFKHGDIIIKTAALAANAIHWFNPLAYIAFYGINTLCELSCDEAVLKKIGADARKQYGLTILNVLDSSINKTALLYPTLCDSKKRVK